MRNRTLLCRAPLTLLTLAFVAACGEAPTESLEAPETAFAKGKPPDCGGSVPLSITIDPSGDALTGDLLLSDGSPKPYVEGEDNVGAHLSINGNLMFWTSQYGATSRYVKVNTVDLASNPMSRQTTDRIFTNTHDNPGGDNACGLTGMAAPSTGSAVFVVELGDTGDGFVGYGHGCETESGEVDTGERVTTHLSDDRETWTITGTRGVHCKSNGLRGKNAKTLKVGDAGPFSMTLKRI